MIVKRRDSREADDAEELKELLEMRLSPKQRFLVERELRFVASGERGEGDSAYFLNFHFKSSPNWAVIHDLRLTLGDSSAQIDHIVMDRFLQIFVLESKNYAYGIKITHEGEFLIYHNGTYYPVESPIEQNARHTLLLQKFIEVHSLGPRRLGFTMSPDFASYVIVSPTSRIIRPKPTLFDTSHVVKSDQVCERIKKEADSIPLAAVRKVVSPETLHELAANLVKHHKPIRIDYRAKFGIAAKRPESPPPAAPSEPSSPNVVKDACFTCHSCGKPITLKAVQYCWDRKEIFKGQAYCFECQKTLRAGTA